MSNYLRKITLSAVAIGFLCAFAVPVHASSLTQAQISAIVGLLQSFGANPSIISNVEVALGQTQTQGSSCVALARNLSVGAQGDDVSALQALLGVRQTGYFGALTRQAVQNWQSAHGISAIGVVGPQTRAALTCTMPTTPPVVLPTPTPPVSSPPVQTPTTTTPVIPTPPTPAPSGLIDSSSVISYTNVYSLFGTASSTNMVSVGVGSNPLQNATVTNGQWSVQVTGNGGDLVSLYAASSSVPLATSTLIATSGPYVAIDQNSLSATANTDVIITGIANVPAIRVGIGSGLGSSMPAVTVTNGHWQRDLGAFLYPGIQLISVYDSSGDHRLVTGNLVISGSGI